MNQLAQERTPSCIQSAQSLPLQTMESLGAWAECPGVSAVESITATSSHHDAFQQMSESPMWTDIVDMNLDMSFDGVALQCEPLNGDRTSVDLFSAYSSHGIAGVQQFTALSGQ